MAYFYTGQWTGLIYPKETEAWHLPLNPNEYLTDTMAPEDLLVDPEDFDEVPERTQYGDTLWNVQTFLDSWWYVQTLPEGSWYIPPASDSGVWYVHGGNN